MRPAFLPLLIFCVFYRLEVYSVAYMRLGDLLVSSGIITGEQLEQALPCPARTASVWAMFSSGRGLSPKRSSLTRCVCSWAWTSWT